MKKEIRGPETNEEEIFYLRCCVEFADKKIAKLQAELQRISVALIFQHKFFQESERNYRKLKEQIKS